MTETLQPDYGSVASAEDMDSFHEFLIRKILPQRHRTTEFRTDIDPALPALHERALAWANNFNAKTTKRGLYLRGCVGSGKTQLACEIAKILVS